MDVLSPMFAYQNSIVTIHKVKLLHSRLKPCKKDAWLFKDEIRQSIKENVPGSVHLRHWNFYLLPEFWKPNHSLVEDCQEELSLCFLSMKI